MMTQENVHGNKKVIIIHITGSVIWYSGCFNQDCNIPFSHNGKIIGLFNFPVEIVTTIRFFTISKPARSIMCHKFKMYFDELSELKTERLLKVADLCWTSDLCFCK